MRIADPSTETGVDLSAEAAELRIAVFRLFRRLRAERGDHGVTDSQLAVLVHLIRRGPTTPGRIAESEGVSAPSMNRTVNALEVLGAVRRVPDPDDGRKVVIEITDLGASIVEETKRVRNAWIERALAGLDADELAALLRAAEVMGRMAEQ